ncbi:ATP-grasp domain-containing protein [Kineosporia succinea]|uniref:ATP-grasp domain-containing protein n=1 Tax=Kineosporia succinea TaxID=84632 RepID=A0ABT9PEC8_9ACTN|nr:ATP-grasp domain-containing protein [Kineosporia succinea]MDP9831067.1 hypothetical protein [Kineosporia succinea]
MRHPFAEPGPGTLVVLPSMTLGAAGLAKIPGVMHYEERMLYALRKLRRPGGRVVFLSSVGIDPAFLRYSLQLMAPDAESWRRLTLLPCDDPDPVPLTVKIRRSPALVHRLRQAIGDPADALIIAFNGSPQERSLALELGVPLFAPDPDLAVLGTKSGGRTFFRAAGLPVAEGVEGLRDEGDVVGALAELRSRQPDLAAAMVKLNEGFGASGNATFSFAGAPGPGPGLVRWIARELPSRAVYGSPPDDWAHYRQELERCGAAVECFVQGEEVTSPSAQVMLVPGQEARVVSTQDQVLGGPERQIFTGATFPARPEYRRQIRRLAGQAGQALAAAGVTGLVSVDFVSARTGTHWQHHAVEVNLRMGGGTAPYFFVDALVQGTFDETAEEYVAPDGRPRVYFATDRLIDPAYRSLDPEAAIRALERSGTAFSDASRTGTFGYMLGALEIGRLGVISVATALPAARAGYRRVAEELRESSRSRL